MINVGAIQNQILIYVTIILLSVLVIAGIYLIFALRKINIFFKKADYLVEDLTYKSEMLNSGVEVVANLQNYVDTFNVATKRNIKSITNLIFRNRNIAYYFINKVRDNAKQPAKKTHSKSKTNTSEQKNTTSKTTTKPVVKTTTKPVAKKTTNPKTNIKTHKGTKANIKGDK
jgi:lipopolysaccharide export LptBFGC system permease protein LptF